MTNSTAAEAFRTAAGIEAVLAHVTNENRGKLSRRMTQSGAPGCSSTAGGVKLKLVERDITFGSDGNANFVAAALRRQGYHVLMLSRSNHLDTMIGGMSRRRTGVLHCRHGAKDAGCDPAKLNVSLSLKCSKARDVIDQLRLRKRASSQVFRGWNDTVGGVGSLLRVEYEALVANPRMWLSAMRLLRLPDHSACLLRDAHQKRVVQTQRELISNYAPFAACLRRQGTAYAKLLVPDRRPTSGKLPRETTFCREAQGQAARPAARATQQSGRRAGRDPIVIVEGPLASPARI